MAVASHFSLSLSSLRLAVLYGHNCFGFALTRLQGLFWLWRQTTAYQYCTRAEDEIYRHTFNEAAVAEHSAPSPALQLLEHMNAICAQRPADRSTKWLQTLSRRLHKQCGSMCGGVALWQRIATILAPTLVYQVVAFLVPMQINNHGFLASGVGGLTFTLMMAASLTLCPAANGFLALDFAITRIIPGALGLVAFLVTLIPDLGYLRDQTFYLALAVVVPVGLILLLDFHKPMFDAWAFFMIRQRHNSLSIEDKRSLAAHAAQLLEKDAAFGDDARARSKNGDITPGMTDAISLMRGDIRLFIDIVILLSGVDVPSIGYSFWYKLPLVVPPIITGCFNAYVFRNEALTLTSKIGGAITTTLAMLRLAILPHCSPAFASHQFTNRVVGSLINTLVVTLPVFITHNTALSTTWKFVLIAGGNAVLLFSVAHHISAGFGKIAEALAGADPIAEEKARRQMAIDALQRFAARPDLSRQSTPSLSLAKKLEPPLSRNAQEWHRGIMASPPAAKSATLKH